MGQRRIDSLATTDRSEGFGERLLGTMIERAHEMPPQLIAPLVAEVIAAIGGHDVTVFLQDYEQQTLVPLPGRGLVVGEPEPIDGSDAGRAFLSDAMIEQTVTASVRLFVPLLDGTDRVGVLAFTMARVGGDDGAWPVASRACSPTCWSPRVCTPTASSRPGGSSR